jgi:hypothetical protein
MWLQPCGPNQSEISRQQQPTKTADKNSTKKCIATKQQRMRTRNPHNPLATTLWKSSYFVFLDRSFALRARFGVVSNPHGCCEV